MRFRLCFLAVLTISAFLPLAAQQAPSIGPQAVQILQQALGALSGHQTLTDVTLTGTAHRIAGSDDEMGQAILKAIPSGAARIEFDFPSGTQKQTYNNSSGSPAGVWSGADAVSHRIFYHNLLVDPTWFFPTFPIMRRLSATYMVADLGLETRNGQSVEHLVTYELSSLKLASSAPTIEQLSQMEFFLDSTTFLPVAINFNIHPDKNAGLDIPVEVRFSDYRQVNGCQIPFHVQQFINNSLTLELELSAASLNTGLGESSFSF
jgi:hypothetical protein